MLTIDRLRLSLPAGFETRADRIVRLAATELGTMPIRDEAHLERLVVPTIAVSPRMSDREIAAAIATGVLAQLLGDER